MQNRNIFLIFIIVVLIVALGFAGYFYFLSSNNNNYNLNNTFSKEGLSFNYPNNFIETNTTNIVSGGSENKYLGTYSSPDNKTKIVVSESPLNNVPSETIEQLKDSSISSIKSSSDAQFLSDTTLNLTGIPEAYEVIYTGTDPKTNEFRKGFFLFLGKQGQKAYGIQVYGPNETFNNTKSLYDKILPTIKINGG